MRNLMLFLILFIAPVMAMPYRDLPAFRLEQLDGTTITLNQRFENKRVVILNFFTTWCPYCKNELEDLSELYQTYEDKGVEIIPVSLDQSPGAVERYMKKNKLSFKPLMGSREISQFFAVSGIPVTVIIGPGGRVIEKFVGYRKPAYVENIIRNQIKEPENK